MGDSRAGAIERGAGGEQSLTSRRVAPSAQFPVILAGGGIVMVTRKPMRSRSPNGCRRPLRAAMHNDAFRKASMRAVVGLSRVEGRDESDRKADVVLGSHAAGPFGTLPQYGIAYWPKSARIIPSMPTRRCSVS